MTALREAGKDRWGKRIWLAQCACGNKRKLSARQLKRNVSCGCMKSDLARKAATTHGLSKTGIYNVWHHMLARCYNKKNKSWARYGKRGITVCQRWHTFENFAADMLPTYKSGLTIERKNNNGNYILRNCIWVPLGTQAKNRRTTQRIQTPWGIMIAADCARKVGIGHSGLRKRIANWPKERWFEKSQRRY